MKRALLLAVALLWGGLVGAQVKPLYTANVLDFGADSTGVTDSTTAIANAISSIPSTGGILSFPRGTFQYSSIAINKSYIWMQGAGKAATTLVPNVTTGDTITINGVSQDRISDLDVIVSAGSPMTAGNLIRVMNSHDISIDHVTLYGPAYVGLSLEGGASQFHYDFHDFEMTGSTNACISVGNSAALHPQDIFISQGVLGSCGDGMLLVNVSGIYVHDVDTINSTDSGIKTFPGAGQTVRFARFVNVLEDTSTVDGWNFTDNGGSLLNIQCVACWGATNIVGMLINSSNLNGLTVTGGDFGNNQNQAIYLQAGTNVTVNAVTAGYNSQSGSGNYPAIEVAAGVTKFTLTNNLAGTAGITEGSQKTTYGIQIDAGSSDFYTLAFNQLAGNVTGTYLDGGTGGHKFIVDNNTGIFKLGSGGQLLLNAGVLTSTGANNVQIGGPQTISPVTQTLSAYGALSGTDTDTAGADWNIISGAGTGAATGSCLKLKTPTPTTSGTTQQTYNTQFSICDAAISIGNTVGNPTFTLLGSGTLSGTPVNNLFASPPAIGGTTPSTGAFTKVLFKGTTYTVGTGTGACATTSTLTGSAEGGSFLCTGTAGASTIIINLPTTTTVWECHGSDVASGVVWGQITPTSTSSCKMTGTIATTSDKIVFGASGH